MENGCPADAPVVEPSSSAGQGSPQPEQPLLSAVLALTASMDRQNELLGQIVAQNADLIGMLAQQDPDEADPMFDLSGRPLSG